jgi:hypothetical protein
VRTPYLQRAQSSVRVHQIKDVMTESGLIRKVNEENKNLKLILIC